MSKPVNPTSVTETTAPAAAAVVTTPLPLDALLPAEMASKAEAVGMKKATMDFLSLFALAVLAGAFISLGAIFCTTILTGAGGIPYGVGRMLAGLAFCLGLILVIVGGAELFTGNNLIMMAWANKKVTIRQLLYNWSIVYAGNFVGSIGTVLIMFFTGQYLSSGGAVGLTALGIAEAKCSLGFIQAIASGIMCNALVCMAVWLCFSARSTTDKILSILFPISAFVAAGFEHSIANMYFIPIALLIKGWAPGFWSAPAVVEAGKTAASYPHLTLLNFLGANLVPVTLGNMIGGGIMVGLVYWFIFLRKR